MLTNLGKLSLVTVRKNMGEFGHPEVVPKVENEVITKVDYPKSDISNEDDPQDDSKNNINSISNIHLLFAISISSIVYSQEG